MVPVWQSIVRLLESLNVFCFSCADEHAIVMALWLANSMRIDPSLLEVPLCPEWSSTAYAFRSDAKYKKNCLQVLFGMGAARLLLLL